MKSSAATEDVYDEFGEKKSPKREEEDDDEETSSVSSSASMMKAHSGRHSKKGGVELVDL